MELPELVADYRELYDEFIPPGSTNELNIAYKTREAVTKAVKEGVFICKFVVLFFSLLIKIDLVNDLIPVTEDVVKSLYRDIYPR